MNYIRHNQIRPDAPLNYASQDLQGEWEFKILTSVSGAFRKSSEINNAREEESRAGWILVEKLDDHRLRFKRPIQMATDDIRLEVDPYRSYYDGMLQIKWRIILVIVAIGIAVCTYLWVRQNILSLN